MNIADRYMLKEVIKELETAFQIDGVDFSFDNTQELIRTVKMRINRQYQLDLSDKKITDTDFEINIMRERRIKG